jgi:V8-like Glu-specific endopeptidase
MLPLFVLLPFVSAVVLVVISRTNGEELPPVAPAYPAQLRHIPPLRSDVPSSRPRSSRVARTTGPAARPFDGVPTVGALTRTATGRESSHFCTASVVDSPRQNLIMTAAHCVGRQSRSGDLGIAFVPGYHDGKAPYGVWVATRIFVDTLWESSADPDHDVAFLQVSRSRDGEKIQGVTGGAQIGIGRHSNATVHVVGYPNSEDQPISCQNRIIPRGTRQMEFRCRGFMSGTSGGPFIARDGAIIGIIGGYQKGGYSPDISFSITFGAEVRALYVRAGS